MPGCWCSKLGPPGELVADLSPCDPISIHSIPQEKLRGHAVELPSFLKCQGLEPSFALGKIPPLSLAWEMARIHEHTPLGEQ